MHKLYMLLLGCRPPGRFTEQHDIFFGIAERPGQLIPHIKKCWPEAGNKIHVDACRAVTVVDDYSIIVKEKGAEKEGENLKLYFINLGGYKRDEFEEFHYKTLVVAADKGVAIQKAKDTAFYKHVGFAGAPSHVDDKYGIDVDDVYELQDVLPAAFKQQYSIHIKAGAGIATDAIELGYITMDKLALL